MDSRRQWKKCFFLVWSLEQFIPYCCYCSCITFALNVCNICLKLKSYFACKVHLVTHFSYFTHLQLKENILPLLKGQPQLLQSFLSLFTEEEAKDPGNSRFEVLQLDAEDRQVWWFWGRGWMGCENDSGMMNFYGYNKVIDQWWPSEFERGVLFLKRSCTALRLYLDVVFVLSITIYGFKDITWPLTMVTPVCDNFLVKGILLLATVYVIAILRWQAR